MATSDHPSDLVNRVAYPSLARPGLRTDWRFPALPREAEKQLPVRSNLQEKEVGDIVYLIERRPQNLWAAIGSLAFLSSILAQAAIDAVKQWRYKPYLIEGEPVEVDSRITINFTLAAS
jgi:Gram-negative bacterial TonB protein C-terminal